jgi:hypothetical protein
MSVNAALVGAAFLFLAALCMVAAGVKIVASARETRDEIAAQAAIIEALNMDLRTRDERLDAQGRLLRAANDYMTKARLSAPKE